MGGDSGEQELFMSLNPCFHIRKQEGLGRACNNMQQYSHYITVVCSVVTSTDFYLISPQCWDGAAHTVVIITFRIRKCHISTSPNTPATVLYRTVVHLSSGIRSDSEVFLVTLFAFLIAKSYSQTLESYFPLRVYNYSAKHRDVCSPGSCP